MSMDTLIIFGAKYLYLLSLAAAAIFFLRAPKDARKELFLYALVVLPAAYVLAKIAGFLYYDPRPFVEGGFAPLIPHTADNGFPSDHTLLTSAVAAVVTRFGRKTGAFLWVVAVLVGASRVAADIHHPVDIAGSIAISLLAAAAASYFFNKKASA